uniref:SRPBCC domain-containing protein n=1 Tax=Desertifilum tharense IPPAS B-1220 TaxID=1781255 RepID=A0ACD5GN85_9CYAN
MAPIRARAIAMPSVYTTVEISAPKTQVWQALIAKQQWVRWNTYLYDLDPHKPLKVGQQVLLSIRRLPGEEEIAFQPTITLLQPQTCLQWVSGFLGFRNESTFSLQEIGFRRTQYTHQERYSGWFSGWLFPLLRHDEQKGIQRMVPRVKALSRTTV